MASGAYDASTMPTTYDNEVNQASESAGIIDKEWMKSINGLLKVAQIVTSIIVIICASVWPFFAWDFGGGWVQFVSIAAFVLLAIGYVLYLFRIPDKLAARSIPWKFAELVFYAVFTLFYMIAAIVSSVFGHKHSSIGACAFFTWLATVLFAADIYFALMKWRASGEGPNLSRLGLGGGGSSGTSQGGATPMPADPYAPPPPEPTVSSVEKGTPAQY